MRRFGRRGRSRPSHLVSRDWGGLISFNEAYRVLRSNLAVALADLENPVVVVTSTTADEGKTVTCTKLASSFALAGRRVVLVDLDLRHATAHRVIGAHNEFGVTDVLLGRRTLEECLQYIELPERSGRRRRGMYFLATGPAVNNPTELLGLGRTARMLEGLAGQADLVLLDTPPVLPVADTLVIGRMAAGAILVVASRTTAVAAIQKAKDLLTRNQTRLLGLVLNKFEERDANFSVGYYGYGYGYGYGDRVADDRAPAPGVEEAAPAPVGAALNGRSNGHSPVHGG